VHCANVLGRWAIVSEGVGAPPVVGCRRPRPTCLSAANHARAWSKLNDRLTRNSWAKREARYTKMRGVRRPGPAPIGKFRGPEDVEGRTGPGNPAIYSASVDRVRGSGVADSAMCGGSPGGKKSNVRRHHTAIHSAIPLRLRWHAVRS